MSPPTLPTHCNLRRDPFNESKTTEPPRQPLASPLIPPPIRATVPGPEFPVQPPLRATVPGPHNKHQTAGPPEEFPVRPSALAPQSRPPTARLPVQPGYSVPGPHSKPQIRKPATLPRSCLERATTSASMIGRLSRSSSESSLTPNYVNVERQHEGRLISVHEGNTFTNKHLKHLLNFYSLEYLSVRHLQLQWKFFLPRDTNEIGHVRVAFNLCFKTSPDAQLFTLK